MLEVYGADSIQVIIILYYLLPHVVNLEFQLIQFILHLHVAAAVHRLELVVKVVLQRGVRVLLPGRHDERLDVFHLLTSRLVVESIIILNDN